MKRNRILFLFLMLSAVGCKNTFIDDYNKFVGSQTAKESETPDAAADYFVTVKDDNGLLVKPSLPFPGNVTASQNRYPDKVEVTWHPVTKPAGTDSVTYSVYRKNSQDDSSAWVRIAEGLTECKWTDNAYAASETPGTEEGGDGGNEGGGTEIPGIPWTEIQPPLPVLDDEAIKYGIDISQEDNVIKEQIKIKLKEYRNDKGQYKVIFTGKPKDDYLVSASLTKLTLEVAKDLSISDAIIDVSKVYFNERKIKSRMFRGGVSLGYFNLSFILPENIIRVIEGNAFSFLNNYLR